MFVIRPIRRTDGCGCLGVTAWKTSAGALTAIGGSYDRRPRLDCSKVLSFCQVKAGLGISARILSANLYGHQFRAAARILNGFDSVLGCESSHNQCQLAVGCRLDGNLMNPLHVFRGASTGTVHFHNKFSVFRGFFPLAWDDKVKEVKTTQERVKKVRRGNLIKFNARLLRNDCQIGSTLTRSCLTDCVPSQG